MPKWYYIGWENESLTDISTSVSPSISPSEFALDDYSTYSCNNIINEYLMGKGLNPVARDYRRFYYIVTDNLTRILSEMPPWYRYGFENEDLINISISISPSISPSHISENLEIYSCNRFVSDYLIGKGLVPISKDNMYYYYVVTNQLLGVLSKMPRWYYGMK